MKRIILLFAALSLFSFSAHAGEIKIGYVDFAKAVSESDQGKEATSTLEKMFNEKKEVIDAKGNEIKKLEEEMAKQASVMTPETLKKKQSEREKMVKEIQRMAKDSEEDLQKKREEYLQHIATELRVIIEKLGEKEGYTAIFEVFEGGILYMPKGFDLTDKVIKSFNETAAAAKP